jgi:integration host factor subunit alpha
VGVVETLTRKELREAVYSRIGTLSRRQAGEILDQVFEEITAALIGDEEVKLRAFGKFKLHNKKERIGRNPKTGIEAVISARRIVSFAPSKQLTAIVNGEAVTDAMDEDQ